MMGILLYLMQCRRPLAYCPRITGRCDDRCQRSCSKSPLLQNKYTVNTTRYIAYRHFVLFCFLHNPVTRHRMERMQRAMGEKKNNNNIGIQLNKKKKK